MQPDCTAARENIDACAIGALDADEARSLEAHLAACDDCAELLDHAAQGGVALALAVPLQAAGPALKARVLASAAILSDAARPQRRAPWWQAAAAVLAIASAGGLAWGIATQRRVDDLEERNVSISAAATEHAGEMTQLRAALQDMAGAEARLASSLSMQEAMVYVVSQPDMRRTAMTGTDAAPAASARYLWSPSEQLGTLVATALPALPEGGVYRMWAVYRGGRWVATGDFTSEGDGTGHLVVRGDEGDELPDEALVWFCVTVEPAGAGTGSRGQMVLRSPNF
ncbi:MAG: anti-sigma factor [Chloroflexi bacterium]|nr:anti-sigma factor [Chloroflexota bacterium]